MKKFFVWFLIVLVPMCGIACNTAYLFLPGAKWYHLFLLAGAQLIIIPALQWWKDFFYDLFDLN